MPLKRTSPITEALEVVRERMRDRLQRAATKYFEEIGTASGVGRRPWTTISDLKEARREIMEREAIFRKVQERAYKELEESMQAFDIDVRELEVWQTAATANDKLRP